MSRRLLVLLLLALLTPAPTAYAGTRDPAPRTGFDESFATVRDGPAAPRLRSGEAVSNYAPYSSATPTVRAGRLTTLSPPWAESGSYRVVHLDGDVARLGATFSFTPWVVSGGAFCLSVQQTDIARTTPVPVSPLHLVVTPVGWQVDVNTEGGTTVDPVASGVFAEPLVADGRTLLRMSAVIDREHRRVTVSLPDGTTKTLTDDAFGLAGGYLYVEPFKVPSVLAPLMSNALVARWWGSAGA